MHTVYPVKPYVKNGERRSRSWAESEKDYNRFMDHYGLKASKTLLKVMEPHHRFWKVGLHNINRVTDLPPVLAVEWREIIREIGLRYQGKKPMDADDLFHAWHAVRS
ncbi:hypothetical protein L596_006551 [Steinernema carpocapsae]|uniref:Uncharacterized protein n=1 Tax=Steinernema carpocapsae TaxID=34508 RepID=A0A4U8V2N3_STECR|nr:hypothetical protein L596_006551 [Steinernema carpocapsae]